MFTGIVEGLVTVRAVGVEDNGRRLIIEYPPMALCAKLGDSIALNGCCLTVVQRDDATFAFQAGPETLARTNLGTLAAGDRVNLERSLAVGDQLGGHFVQGHVDGIGTVDERQEEGDWVTFWVAAAPDLVTQMVPKGSVAVDGVSLTLVEVHRERFSIALIPHTLQVTTLGFRRPGEPVNLETDILGKYVRKFLEEAS